MAHHNGPMAVTMPRYSSKAAKLCLSVLFCGLPALAQSQSQQSAGIPESENGPRSLPGAGASAGERLTGSITGTIVDGTGAVVVGARIRLAREDQSPNQEIVSGEDGQFSFAGIAPGPFQLTIVAAGFSPQTVSGVLSSGQVFVIPPMALTIATSVTEIRVVPHLSEEAQEEIKEQEKQRVLGVVPNFYVTYVAGAAPLSPKQKFELAWKSTVDPVTFGLNGAVAGIQQAHNDFSGYGQGSQGYARRYGASYADLATQTFIGGAILPSLLKQDPRYFYKGSGSKRSRILYAIANSVICKGDDGHWQPNYSGIFGSIAAGAISNAYYPAQDRNGAALTFETTLFEIGETAASNLLQEFVIRKLTPNASNRQAIQP
jgi:hypothetical protein